MKTKAQKKLEAQQRQSIYDAMSLEEKLMRCVYRNGHADTKQAKKLKALIKEANR